MSKKYGLNKERELKNNISKDSNCLFVSRSRGSFGAFDIQAYYKDYERLISVKSTKQRYYKNTINKEIGKIKNIKVPDYCRKYLYYYLSPNKHRKEKGWYSIKIN